MSDQLVARSERFLKVFRKETDLRRRLYSDSREWNSVVWIRSLPAEDVGLGLRVSDDVKGLCASNKFSFIEQTVYNKNDFIHFCLHLEHLSFEGLRPTICIDAHGHKEHGLKMYPSGENVDWSVMLDCLRGINIFSRNNLCCILAACFGAHSLEFVNTMEPAPFFSLIAPEEAITSGAIEDRIPTYFSNLIKTNDEIKAYSSALAEVMTFHHCRKDLFCSLGCYEMLCGSRRAKNKRRERVLTKLLDAQPWYRSSLSTARQVLRDKLDLNDDLITKLGNVFLHGRPVLFSHDDINNVVRKARF